MHGTRPCVRECLAGNRDELPVVAGVVQCQFQDAVGGVVPHLAGGQHRVEAVEIDAAGAHDKRSNAVARIRIARSIHRRQPFVVVPVTAKPDIDTVVVQRLPQRLQERVRARRTGGTVERPVPHRDDVVRRAGRQIGPQPLLLRRPCLAATAVPQPGALAVQDDDVPVAEGVAVIATRRSIACRADLHTDTVEVIEVGRGIRRGEVMVASRRTCACFMTTPGRVVAVGELRRGTALVRVIAEREHRA